MRILKLHQYAPPRPPIQKDAGTAGDLALAGGQNRPPEKVAAAIERWLREAREPAHQVQGVQSNWREFLAQRRTVCLS